MITDCNHCMSRTDIEMYEDKCAKCSRNSAIFEIPPCRCVFAILLVCIMLCYRVNCYVNEDFFYCITQILQIPMPKNPCNSKTSVLCPLSKNNKKFAVCTKTPRGCDWNRSSLDTACKAENGFASCEGLAKTHLCCASDLAYQAYYYPFAFHFNTSCNKIKLTFENNARILHETQVSD